MVKRKPQINFQVETAMKLLYDEAKACGQSTTRLCAAGLLLMVEDPHARLHALNRLRDWENSYADTSPKEIRNFVQNAQIAVVDRAS
jgi:hypothetical protein